MNFMMANKESGNSNNNNGGGPAASKEREREAKGGPGGQGGGGKEGGGGGTKINIPPLPLDTTPQNLLLNSSSSSNNSNNNNMMMMMMVEEDPETLVTFKEVISGTTAGGALAVVGQSSINNGIAMAMAGSIPASVVTSSSSAAPPPPPPTVLGGLTISTALDLNNSNSSHPASQHRIQGPLSAQIHNVNGILQLSQTYSTTNTTNATSIPTNYAVVSASTSSPPPSSASPMKSASSPIKSTYVNNSSSTTTNKFPSAAGGSATTSSPTKGGGTMIGVENKVGYMGNLIMRKRESIAYFIELLSPDLKGTKYTVMEVDEGAVEDAFSPRSPLKTSFEGGVSSPVKGGSMDSKPLQSASLTSELPIQQFQNASLYPSPSKLPSQTPLQPPVTVPHSSTSTTSTKTPIQIATTVVSFPKIKTHTLRPPAKDLQQILESRLEAAAAARHRSLQDRKTKLVRHAQAVKFRVMINESRQRLEKLRLQAKHEYTSSSAQLNKQINLRKTREKFGAKVEHAKRVMLLNKMHKFMELRKALSENFVDYLKQDELSDFPTESESRRLTPLGLSVHLAEDDYDDFDEDEADKERFPIPDSPERTIHSSGSSPSETAKKFHKEFNSDYLFAPSPKTRSETLASSIRKSKSLPDFVLKESDDGTFLELLSLLPPTTRFTLRELEMDEILGNMQLRHDMVFDPDLQFKSTDSTDEDFADTSKAYWSELHDEVKEGEMYRIPLLLAEVRAILIELLPNGPEMKEEIYAQIDTHLISQLIQHGIMDPSKLIAYLADVFKTNCAPIRDKVVDRMVDECAKGDIVTTLKTCFEILELMKLDYTNHQMSRLRPYIIEHSVTYEWKYFKNQYEAGLIKLDNTKAWLKKNWYDHKAAAPGSPNPAFDLYPLALMDIIGQASRFSEEDILPETLRMDLTRIISFYNSWQDITILATILIVFKQVAGTKCDHHDLITAKTSLWLLLNDSDSTMSHITLQMASMAGKVRGSALSTKESTDLHTMTEKTLAPGSKLYELVQKRVGTHLETGLTVGSKMNLAVLGKHGLLALQQEISDLIGKILPVGTLNKSIFGKLYSTLLDEIREGKEMSPDKIMELE